MDDRDDQIEAAARRAVVDATLTYVLALLARANGVKLDVLHEQLIGHVTSTIRTLGEGDAFGVRDAELGREVLGRFEAAACQLLDQYFTAAENIKDR